MADKKQSDIKAKKQPDIKKELIKEKKEGETASKKASDLAKLAEKTESILENIQGEATSETAQVMESAAAAFQAGIEKRYLEAEQKSESVNESLEDKQQKFDEGVIADQADISSLSKLKTEAKKAGVSVENIAAAEKAKQKEVKFLTSESTSVETSQKEIEKNLKDAKARRKSTRSTYQSKNTLGS